MASLSSIEDCASLIKSNAVLGLQSGIVIAVPIPESEAVRDASNIEGMIADSVKSLADDGIKGKDVTPHLLDKMKQLTKGDSLRASIFY